MSEPLDAARDDVDFLRAELEQAKAKANKLTELLVYFAAERRYGHGAKLGLLQKQHEAREALAEWER